MLNLNPFKRSTSIEKIGANVWYEKMQSATIEEAMINTKSQAVNFT